MIKRFLHYVFHRVPWFIWLGICIGSGFCLYVAIVERNPKVLLSIVKSFLILFAISLFFSLFDSWDAYTLARKREKKREKEAARLASMKGDIKEGDWKAYDTLFGHIKPPDNDF